jgi:hypothetical protein
VRTLWSVYEDIGPDGTAAAHTVLPEEQRNKIDRFRVAAAARGLSAEDVERWLRTARRSVRLSPGADGPVVGRFGGPLLLPVDVPAPELSSGSSGRQSCLDHQLIATIDLAAVPAGATDPALPPDGHLLLFADAELECEDGLSGGAVHIPAGTPVEEREQNLDYETYEYDTPGDLDAGLRREGPLRLAREVSFAPHEAYHDIRFGSAVAKAWAEAVDEIWPPTHVPLQLGGNAVDHEGWGDPVRGSAAVLADECDVPAEEWVLLAQWEGLPMATVYWTIPRQDLATPRFDRVVVQMYANP